MQSSVNHSLSDISLPMRNLREWSMWLVPRKCPTSVGFWYTEAMHFNARVDLIHVYGLCIHEFIANQLPVLWWVTSGFSYIHSLSRWTMIKEGNVLGCCIYCKYCFSSLQEIVHFQEGTYWMDFVENMEINKQDAVVCCLFAFYQHQPNIRGLSYGSFWQPKTKKLYEGKSKARHYFCGVMLLYMCQFGTCACWKLEGPAGNDPASVPPYVCQHHVVLELHICHMMSDITSSNCRSYYQSWVLIIHNNMIWIHDAHVFLIFMKGDAQTALGLDDARSSPTCYLITGDCSLHQVSITE